MLTLPPPQTAQLLAALAQVGPATADDKAALRGEGVLGHVACTLGPDSITTVATNGRVLAEHHAPSDLEACGVTSPLRLVVPWRQHRSALTDAHRQSSAAKAVLFTLTLNGFGLTLEGGYRRHDLRCATQPYPPYGDAFTLPTQALDPDGCVMNGDDLATLAEIIPGSQVWTWLGRGWRVVDHHAPSTRAFIMAARGGP